MDIVMHTNNFTNILNAYKEDALYNICNGLPSGYTFIKDCEESITGTLKCLGYKNSDVVVYVTDGTNYIEINEYLKSVKL